MGRLNADAIRNSIYAVLKLGMQDGCMMLRRNDLITGMRPSM